MGISSALYSGVSGLNTNAQAMSVIGNNLANTNTLGFKGARTVFSDLLSSTISGSGGASQVGRGVGMSRVDNIFSQGTFETTESTLDAAIEGEGFFLLKQPDDNTTYYSRAGAFRFDEQGFLVNPEGLRVQGQPYDANGELIPGVPSDIAINNFGLVAGTPTTEVTLTTNLDSSTVVPVPLPAFDLTDPTTFDYSTASQVFDSLGNEHLINTYYVKTAPNTWAWHWSYTDADGTTVSGDGTDPLSFTSEGVLEDPAVPGSPATDPITGSIAAIDWANGSSQQDVTFTFNTTQFNSDSTVIGQQQNGFGAGELTDLGINEEGAVVASYSNGDQALVAHLVLGTFNNPNGLELVGNNLYRATTTSGNARTGLPGPELGKVFTNSLEQSNVDMGAEFVRMITVQRGFQANSKIITTVDELLGELINLKR